MSDQKIIKGLQNEVQQHVKEKYQITHLCLELFKQIDQYISENKP